MKNRIYKIIFTTLLLLSSSLLKAQVDNLHYIPPFFAPPYIENNRYVDVGPTTNPSGNYFHRVVLSTSVEDTFEVNIRTKTDFVATVSISKATPAYVDLPTYAYYNASNNTTYDLPKTVIGYTDLNTVLNDQGLILEADQDFYVNISQRSSAQGDILTSKGRVGKGTHFFSGHIPNKVLTNSGYRPRRSNFLSVMATEDNTQITFSNTRIKWNGQPQNSFTITLQKEETYVLGAWLSLYGTSTNPDDFNGTEITSTKDIVVNSGSWCGSVADGNSQDMGFDQLVPVDVLGTEFIAVKGEGSSSSHSEKIIVVSPYDGNTIVVNGGESQITLDKGEYHLFEASDYSANQNIYLNSTYGAYVFQSLLGDNNGSINNQTVGFIFIPKLSCEGYKDVSISYINSIGTPQLLLVARKGLNGEIPIVKIDGIKVDSALSTNGKAVTGNSEWLTYKISETDIANHFNDDGDWNVIVESNYAINAALSFKSGVIGGGGFYSGFGIRPSIQSAPRILNTNGCAPGNMELVADDNYYSTYQWYKNGIEIPGETNNVFYPVSRGIYTLKGLTDCGLSRVSTPVDVKTCIFWESKDGDGMDVQIWEDPTALSPPEDPFVFLEFTLAEALDFDIFIRYRTTVPSYITYPATPGIGGDFIPIDYNAQIHIPADSLTGYTDPMWILPDFLDEENEDFSIEIIDVLDVDGNLGAVVQDDQVLVTILDDDSISTTVHIENDFSVVENEGNAFFTVTLSKATGRSVFVDYKTVANTAFSSNDYYTRSGTITFLEGETEKIISVPIINRPGFNGARDFSLVLENETYCLLGNDTSICTIVDKEGEDVFLYYVNDTSAIEGYPLYFNIRLTQQLLEPLSFRLALLEGTATEDDFENNVIDNTTLTANVSVLDESKTLVNGLSFNEGVGNGVFYVQLSNIMDVPVTVMYKTSDNTAEENIDYVPTNNMLLFMPGDSIKKLEIPVLDDMRKEPNENFNFHITKVVNGFNSQNVWEVYIVDNDPLPIVSLETDKSVLENEGFAKFKVLLSSKSNDTISVTYSAYEYDILPDFPAAPGDGSQAFHDFRPITTQRLTFLPGDSVKEIAVQVFQNDANSFGIDYSDEPDEKFYVQLVNVEDATTATINGSAQKSVVTIIEEIVQSGVDKRYIYLDRDLTVTEGTNFSFTVKRFTGTLDSWRVQVSLTHSSTSAADFTSTPTTAFIDIDGADLTKDITFSTFDDNMVETDENFTLQIVAAEYKINALDAWTSMDLLPNRSSVFGTILDNDISDAPQLAVDTFYVGVNEVLNISSEHGVLENDIIYSTNPVNTTSWVGSINATFGTLSAIAADGSFTYTPALDYEGNFSMNYTIQSTKGNNVSSSVYFEVTSMPKRYFINPGDTIYKLEIPTFDDATEEGDEQFTMTAFDLSSTSVRILPGRNASTGTIRDDDFYPLVTNDYFYVNEDNALFPPTANVLDNDVISTMDTISEIVLDTMGVYLQHGNLIVDMALDGTFTYMPDPGFSGRDSFLYTVRDTRTDSVYSPAQLYDAATAVVIIDIIPTNDEPIAVDDYFTIDEDDPITNFNLTQNDLDPDNVGLIISEVWGNNLGTVSIFDNNQISYGPIWFGSDTLYYKLDDLDSYDDPDTGMVVFTIIGEVDREFDILTNESILEPNAMPSGNLTFTVTLSEISYKTRTVSYRTEAIAGNSAVGVDFVYTEGALTFPANDASSLAQDVIIPVMGRGDAPAGDNYDHSFNLVLYNPSTGTILGNKAVGTGTIVNVEPGIRALYVEDDVTVNEGDPASFTVSLIGDLLPYSLNFSATLTEGTAKAGEDYDSTGYNITGSTIIPELTIESAASTPFQYNENVGNAQITFSLSSATSTDVGFRYRVHNSGAATAIWGEDYYGDEQAIIIPAGQTQASIDIPIIDDSSVESNETFFIDISEPLNVTIADPTKTITIVDNDAASAPTIILEGNKNVNEEEGNVQYKVRLSSSSTQTIRVNLETRNGSATSSGNNNSRDYDSKSQTITFNPGDSIAYFDVRIRTGSNSDNNTENFYIDATNPQNATISGPNSGTITIYDEDYDDYIYIYEDLTIEEGNRHRYYVKSTHSRFRFKLRLNLLGNTTLADFQSGQGDYSDIINEDWVYDGNGSNTIDIYTTDDSEGESTESFSLEIIDSDWTNNNSWNNIYALTVLPGRGTAYGIITDNDVSTSYTINDDAYALYSGESISGNVTDNDLYSGYTVTNVSFNTSSVPAGTSIKIEAEDYSSMSGIQNEGTTDTGGGQNVGWIDNGDWMDYSVNVPSAGNYSVAFRVASTSSNSEFNLKDGSGNVLTNIKTGNTGGWQNWTTVTGNAMLSAGNQTLRIEAVQSGWNINWFELSNGGITTQSNGSFTYSAPSGFTGTHTIPVTISLNNGGSNINHNGTLNIDVLGQSSQSGFVIPANQRSTILTVPTTDDVLDEPNEDFLLELFLSDTTTVKLRGNQSATGIIIDNDNPLVLVPDITNTFERQPVTFNVLNNDPSGYGLTLTSVSAPANGTILNFTAGGDITYISDTYFSGADGFQYTALTNQGIYYSTNASVQVQSIEDLENKRSLYCPNATSNITYSIAAPFDAYTFEVWVKPVGNASGGMANLGGGKTITRNGTGNIVLGGFTGSVFIDGIPGNTLVDDKWQHVLITSNTAFNVSAVMVGSNGSTGMQAYYDELRIWNKSINSQSNIEQIMFQELYYSSSIGQLKSLVTNVDLFNTGYAGWGNLLFHAKFNSTDFWDVIGWSTATVNGSATISMDLPFNHYLSGAIDNNWHWTGNWHFGKDYPDALSPEYVILQPANGNNPYLHQGSSYSINSETTIKNLVVLQNADFTLDKGSLRISGNVFRKENDRVIYMRGANGMRLSKSINISY